MKKLFVLAFAVFTTTLINAQIKVTRASVVGKWSVSTMEMPGMMSYNTETDSLVIADAIKGALQDPKQLDQLKAQLKMQAKMAFLFNPDGTASLVSGGNTSTATYTVEEDKSTISITDKAMPKQTMEAGFVNGKLQLKANSPGGPVVLTLKKA